ncbi:bifunctional folylpolyglutamate synthase/dihydrofolate synthase [Pedobacter sp. SAFR-022]|uniref:bifunctional folylpolyglutamate synthase/dihydrofolate synthase n=1 Tax=Pedobacter sp. SAFR-022 TaxID=3436861 RepID=UPI003F7D9E48
MNYSETLDFLYSKLPMFTRIGEAALKKDLTNTLALCESLGNPQDTFKSIHVAGTNGKGSTSHMLAAILQKAGYKTGLYTSPHLKDFRERIRINGKMAPKAFVTAFVKQQMKVIERVQPSFFEVTVAMAFSYFAIEEVDVAVVEVGLGGRLDSTNIIQPELSLITNISLDHINILGDTLPKIAFEKAGIIKAGVPAIVGEEAAETRAVFVDKAAEVGTSLQFASREYQVEGLCSKDNRLVFSVQKNGKLQYKDLALDLNGSYQQYNIPAVLAAVDQLNARGFKIEPEHVYDALSQVKKLTGLQGRWQTLSFNPRVICDTGHNVGGITEVLKNIQATPHARLHFVIGMVKDKDISKILGLLPKEASYYFSQPKLERALPVAALQDQAQAHGLHGSAFQTVTEALSAAKQHAAADDLVFVGGSTFVVAEVL